MFQGMILEEFPEGNWKLVARNFSWHCDDISAVWLDTDFDRIFAAKSRARKKRRRKNDFFCVQSLSISSAILYSLIDIFARIVLD